MHFGNINIKGFKGIEKIDLKDCGNINLIVGKNNTCKTSILEAIGLLVGMPNSQMLTWVSSLRSLPITKESDLKFIFHNLNYSNELKIKATQGKNTSRELQIKPQDNQTTTFDLSKDKQSKQFDMPIGGGHVVNELLFDFKVTDTQSSAHEFKSRVKLKRNEISFQNPEDCEEVRMTVIYLPQGSMSKTLEEKLDDLITAKKIDEVIKVLNIIDENIKGISFGANEMVYIDVGIDSLIPINLAGDGLRRLLSLILALYSAKNGILLVDEIENGLHFSVLKSLWEVIGAAAKAYNVQVFATTHNMETLKYLNDVGMASDDDFKKSVRSYTICRTKEKQLEAVMYNFKEFSFSIKQGIEIR